MIEVELPDGTIAEFPDGTSRDVIKGALQKKFGNKSVISPGVDDFARSAGSGVAKGVVGLGEMMSMPGRGADWLLSKGATALMGEDAPEWTQRPAEFNAKNPAPARAISESAPGGKAILNYDPKTTAGNYAKTVGEFIPGALAFGGGGAVGNAVRYGVIPGLASEAAGQATEGTKAEPYARIAAALGASVLAGRPTGRAKPVFPRADPEDAKMAETLMRKGVTPTVGQVTNNRVLRTMEGSLGEVAGQSDDVTRAAMKSTGSTAARALPDALKSQSDDIVKTMNDAVSGVTFNPSPAMAQGADDVVKEYMRATASSNVVPDVRNIADEIIDAATTPRASQLDLATLKDWRSRLGKLLRGSDGQARDAAWGLRSLIDDATEAQLASAGRTNDIAKLARAREQYRNWIAVSDASTRAGAESGVISPTQLNQSVIRSQGRRNAAIGNTTDLGNLSRAAAGVLRSEPTVSPGGVRSVSAALGSGLAGAGLGSQVMAGNPVLGATLGGAAGVGLQSVGQALMRSAPLQSTLMDPMGKIVRALMASGPGVVGQR